MWLFALLACSPSGPAISDLDVDSGGAGLTDEERMVRDLIDGSGDLQATLEAVAWSEGGWPLATASETFLFVHVAEAGSWSVMGDFNDWEGQPMVQGDGFYWAELTIEEPVGAGYKYTDGGEPLPDPWARSYNWDEFGQLSYVEAPTDLARLDRWPHSRGIDIGDRTVRVYVPAGTGPWPALYMHDGNNLFDPNAFFGGWQMQDALAGRSLLVVGIDNTASRMEDYTHVQDDLGDGQLIGGNGDAYAEYVVALGTVLEDHYGAAPKRGVLGSSLGGLISLHLAEQDPEYWDFAGSMSGTLGWGRFGASNDTMEQRWLTSLPQVPVYVDSGGSTGPDGACRDLDGDGFPEDDPDSSDNYCESRQFVDALAGAGYTWDVNLWHWHEPGAQHNELEWAARVARPLDIFEGL